VNNHREGIAYYLSGTLAGRIPILEALQLLKDDSMFKFWNNPTTSCRRCITWGGMTRERPLVANNRSYKQLGIR